MYPSKKLRNEVAEALRLWPDADSTFLALKLVRPEPKVRHVLVALELRGEAVRSDDGYWGAA